MPNDPQYTDPNPGISRRLILDTTLNDAASRNGINQIRGLDSKGSLGSGIPKHVTNVGASVAQAATGSTSTVRVTFHRDPSDKNYSAAAVWVKGYQGNNNPVQVAQSYESPATFVLNNTGEPVSILVQSAGNGGQAPLSSAPTTGITLPKSTIAGYGTGTTVAYTPAAPPPSFSLAAGQTGDALRYNEYTDGNWDSVNAVPQNFVRLYCDPVNSGVATLGTSLAVQLGGTSARTVSTATEPPLQKLTGSATASTNVTNYVFWGVSSSTSYICLGVIRRFTIRVRMNNTSNVRYWIGLFPNSTSNTANNFTADVPNVGYLAFRYSAGTDTTIQAVSGTSSVAQTVVDTAVSVDTTHTQLFDIAFDGTAAYFYINGALKATISTTVPATSSLMSLGILADNKNTNNANSLEFAWANLSYK